VGDPAKPEDPADRRQGDKLAETLAARDHALFRGKVDKGNLSLAERAIVRVAKAPNSDQRDWDEIRSWAGGIAEELDLIVADD
jgi:menaquinone-dependent protoporphyrinogen oxidase